MTNNELTIDALFPTVPPYQVIHPSIYNDLVANRQYKSSFISFWWVLQLGLLILKTFCSIIVSSLKSVANEFGYAFLCGVKMYVAKKKSIKFRKMQEMFRCLWSLFLNARNVQCFGFGLIICMRDVGSIIMLLWEWIVL